MHINLKEASDEDLIRFFIWDGQSAEEAVEFVQKMLRPNMSPVTDSLMTSLKNYEASFRN